MLCKTVHKKLHDRLHKQRKAKQTNLLLADERQVDCVGPGVRPAALSARALSIAAKADLLPYLHIDRESQRPQTQMLKSQTYIHTNIQTYISLSLERVQYHRRFF